MISNPVGGVKEPGAKRLWSPEAVGWRAYILIYPPAKPKPIQEVEELEEENRVEVEMEEEEVVEVDDVELGNRGA